MKHFIFAWLLAFVFVVPCDIEAQGSPNTYWIPATDFHFVLAEGTPNTVVAAAGTAIQAEISTFGIVGVPMTAADLVSTYFPWPNHWHNKLYPVAARVWWTSTSADDDGTIVWLLDTEEKTIGGEDALEAATVALADGIAFAADSTEVQYGIQATSWDTLGVVALQTYHNDSMIELSVELDDDGTATGDEIVFLGVELYFLPIDYRRPNYFIPGSTAHGTNHGITVPKRAGF